jgi:hypothetical protein
VALPAVIQEQVQIQDGRAQTEQDGKANMISETWTYASSTSVTTPNDLTSILSPGMITKITQGGSTKYFVITTVTFGSPNTTIGLDGAGLYTLTNETITSHIETVGNSPYGVPPALLKVSTTLAGLCPVLPNDVGKTLSGIGTWVTSTGVTNGDSHDHAGGDGAQIDHGGLAGLTDDDHTGYAKLVGRTGGQTIEGDVTAGGDLTLSSTHHATKGKIKVGGSVIESTVSSGTAPIIIASDTVVSNLNASKLEGNSASAFAVSAKGVTNGDSHDHVGGDGAQIDHGGLDGLSHDDHTGYVLLAGRTGGQSIIGGTGASENLTLTSTSNGTKGKITTADQIQSTLAAGTAPFIVASDTIVANLNASKLEGNTSSAFATAAKGVTNGDSHDHTGGDGAAIPSTSTTFAASSKILGRKSSGTGAGEECSLSEVLDFVGSPVRGGILARGASTWDQKAIGAYGQILKSDGLDPVWGTLSGGINYITNYDAGADTSGWDEYADAAGTSPVDGTGGTHTGVTWTRSTSTPLRGAASFLLAKDAANRQGMGTGYVFTIDPVDRASMVTLSFNWLSDVTLAEGDIVVWIAELLDADNSLVSLIQPTPYKLPGTVASANNAWSAQFQTAPVNTHYRLILHIASTSATAWNIKFDQFACGPSVMKQGVPVTDWQAFTPVWGGMANLSLSGGKWRRIGDTMQIMAHARFSGAATGALSIDLPAGYSIDNTKTSRGSYQRLGFAMAHSSANVKYTGGLEQSNTTNTFVFAGPNTAPWAQTVPFTWANSDELYFFLEVPILGWSSNCQISSDAETRVVAASYNCTSAIVVAQNTPINYDTKEYDTHNAVTVGVNTWKFTAPIPGYYSIVCCGVTNTAGNSFLLFKNGANIKFLFGIPVNGYLATGSIDLYLNAGDYISICPGAAGNTTLVNLSTANYVCIKRISGPSQIAASEKVYAMANTNAGQTIAGSDAFTKVVFEDEIKDTHGAYDAPNGRFTAPMAGAYRVTGKVTFASWASGATNYLNIALYKNGSLYSYIGTSNEFNTVTSFWQVGGSDIIYLLAGEYVELFINKGSAGNVNLLNVGTHCICSFASI